MFRFFESLARPAAAAFEPAFAAGVLDQNATHCLSRGGEEVTAIVPMSFRLVADEAEIRFVNQGCGLESLAGRLVSQSMTRELAQFAVDQG